MNAEAQSVAGAAPVDASEPGFVRALASRALHLLDEVLVPAGGFVLSLGLFGVFIALTGNPPLDVFEQMYRGAFGTWFSFQNTLLRAAPLMLTGLCTALPARLGQHGFQPVAAPPVARALFVLRPAARAGTGALPKRGPART